MSTAPERTASRIHHGWDKPVCRMNVGVALLSVTAVAFAAIAIVASMKHWGVVVYAPSGGVAGVSGLAFIALLICRIKLSSKKEDQVIDRAFRAVYTSQAEGERQAFETQAATLHRAEKCNAIRATLYKGLFEGNRQDVTAILDNLEPPLCKELFFTGSIGGFDKTDMFGNQFFTTEESGTQITRLPSLFEYTLFRSGNLSKNVLTALFQTLGSQTLSTEDVFVIKGSTLSQIDDKEVIALILNKCDDKAREALLKEALKENESKWVKIIVGKWIDNAMLQTWDCARLVECVMTSSYLSTLQIKFLTQLADAVRDVSKLSFSFGGDIAKGSLLFLVMIKGEILCVQEVIKKWPALISQSGHSRGCTSAEGDVLPIFGAIYFNCALALMGILEKEPSHRDAQWVYQGKTYTLSTYIKHLKHDKLQFLLHVD